MKKSLFMLPLLMLGAVLHSCKDDTRTLAPSQPQTEFQISLDLESGPAQVTNSSGVNDSYACATSYDLGSGLYEALIYVNLNGDPANQIQLTSDLTVLTDGQIVTDQFMMVMPDGDPHELDKLLIVEKADQSNIILATAGETSIFASQFTSDELMPQDIPLAVFEKSTLNTTVYCVNEYTPQDFGYNSWSLNFVNVYCFDYVVNLSADPCTDDPLDAVGESEITIARLSDGVIDSVYSSESSSGMRGSICFADNSNIPDSSEFYILFLSLPNGLLLNATLSVEQLINYKLSGFWELPIGAPADGNGVIHFDLYGLDLTNNLTEIPHNSNIDTTIVDPWDLQIIQEYSCPSDVVCSDSIFADWKSFDINNSTSAFNVWQNQCFTRTLDSTLLYLGGGDACTLESPLYCFSENDTITIEYEFILDPELSEDGRQNVAYMLMSFIDSIGVYDTFKVLPTNQTSFTYVFPSAKSYYVDFLYEVHFGTLEIKDMIFKPANP